MGNTLASLSLSRIRAAMLNDNMLAADFIILGPIPSNPIALLESKAIIEGGDIRNFEKKYHLALYRSQSLLNNQGPNGRGCLKYM